ncbi:hypothetical protein V6N13_024592 [Hibiscus sabdariffa]
MAIAQQGGAATRVGGYKLPCRASFLHVDPFRLKLGFLAILLAWDGPLDDKGDVSAETTGPAPAEVSAGTQISAERLVVLLAYP